MKRTTIILTITLILLAVMITSGLAETVTVAITGGTLGVTAADVTLSGVVLDGTDTTATSPFGDNTWNGVDARGTGVGWNLTIDATDFNTGGSPNRTIDISEADQNYKIMLTADHIIPLAGNTNPVSQVTSLTDIPTTGSGTLKFLSAAVDTGMGSYNLQPNFELEIPAETYAGTYTSTITVTAVSGP